MIHLSQSSKDILDDLGGYDCQYRGKTEVKGKDAMPTYWLLGKDGFTFHIEKEVCAYIPKKKRNLAGASVDKDSARRVSVEPHAGEIPHEPASIVSLSSLALTNQESQNGSLPQSST
ncbi:hypothetical protein RvY_13142 [Ramazzottius varieornatus]|uniref:Guanylate cyclase domain-containing protein n=1 Tax=Ramazzottius varieornatus TaxID=947166 RepID=A0A1D1VVG7_RAMVA|nr:hypothetical protein RvY_13142 [Ramazzottius varieornatus]